MAIQDFFLKLNIKGKSKVKMNREALGSWCSLYFGQSAEEPRGTKISKVRAVKKVHTVEYAVGSINVDLPNLLMPWSV